MAGFYIIFTDPPKKQGVNFMNELIEERVKINGDITLGATIAYKDKSKKRPLVLLIMGTGKLDRDGNQKGFNSNFYKNLSDMFVSLGYVCIRYDKRGTHESTGNFKKAGLTDLVQDSSNVIEYAKKLEYVDENRIIACGHSEGAMIATLLTKQQNLEKIILLAGACMCLKSAMTYQNMLVLRQYENKKGFLAWYLRKFMNKQKIQKQLNGMFEKAMSAKGDSFLYNGAIMPAKWLREHGSLTDEDFVNMIKEYNGKVLAITGKADLQADYTCLEKISEFENVITFAPEKVNHMMREIDDDNNILTVKKQYKRLAKQPINIEVQEQIEEFLK